MTADAVDRPDDGVAEQYQPAPPMLAPNDERASEAYSLKYERPHYGEHSITIGGP